MLKSELKYDEEPMDTGELLYDDYDEEGEIHSDGDEEKESWKVKKEEEEEEEDESPRPMPTFGRISSGVSIPDKNDELKKLERAKRFAINVENVHVVAVNNESLSRLHKSLGIDKDNERHYRFNAIHMRGTQDMSQEDVFEYFSSFSPSHVEWINDVSCNVVWSDDASAARALINLSKEVKNLDKVHLNADPFEKDLKEKDSNMECIKDAEAVDAREIKAAIPPGLWRLGVETKKSPAILLRFATRADRKQKYAERNSEYYKRYGNPHFGNLPGLVSKSLRRGVFQKYKKFQNNNEGDDEVSGKKNPWGHLAQEWNEIDKSSDRRKSDVKSRITLKRPHPRQKEDLRMSINNRQKHKNVQIKQTELENYISDDDNTWESRVKVPRMKMYADSEEKSESSRKNRLCSQIGVVEDLRNKIDRRRKNKVMMSTRQEVGVSKRYQSKFSTHENDYDDDDDDDDEDEEKGSNWALEQYSDLRESLEQKSRQSKVSKARRATDRTDSEQNESDDASDVYNGHFGHRSPLQIEIENDEYFENESDNTI